MNMDAFHRAHRTMADAFARQMDAFVPFAESADDREPIVFEKNAITMRISREMARDQGLIEPNRDELTERSAWHERFRRDDAARQQRYAVGYMALLEADPATAVVARLHAPDDHPWALRCEGCDFGGYDAEAPDWPCRTIGALADHHDIDMTYSGKTNEERA